MTAKNVYYIDMNFVTTHFGRNRPSSGNTESQKVQRTTSCFNLNGVSFYNAGVNYNRVVE
jgi:hypothetical protein